MNVRNTIFGLLALVMLAAGCIPTSVYPLYFKNDLIFDSELLGTWGNPEDPMGDKLIFEKGNKDSYDMYYFESGEDIGGDSSTAEFVVHLIKLGDNLFLDVFPEEPESANDFYNIHLVPTHSFMRVEIVGDTMKLGLFDYSWLENNLRDGTVEIKHATRDDMTVLTASTEELQKFAEKYADAAFPYDDDFMLLRIH